jgi:hypothetical protein
MKWFWRFSIAKNEGMYYKNLQIFISGFQNVVKKYRRMIKALYFKSSIIARFH